MTNNNENDNLSDLNDSLGEINDSLSELNDKTQTSSAADIALSIITTTEQLQAATSQ